MADQQQTCFVVMGFGIKTDYHTSRELDLDKSYKYIIKAAVEAAGLKCIRADQIPHAGTIDVPMFEQKLKADKAAHQPHYRRRAVNQSVRHPPYCYSLLSSRPKAGCVKQATSRSVI